MRPFLEVAPLAQVGDEAAVAEYGGRWGTPEEVAGVVAMLCSAEAGYCTGQVVCANGGMIFSG